MNGPRIFFVIHWQSAHHLDRSEGLMPQPVSVLVFFTDRHVERYLYDLHADPHEEVNLIGRKAHDEVREDLKRRLVRQMLAAGEDEPVIEDAQFDP